MRASSITVVLEHDLKDESLEQVLGAIRQLRGVLSVTPDPHEPIEVHVAEMRVRHDLSERMWKMLSEARDSARGTGE